MWDTEEGREAVLHKMEVDTDEEDRTQTQYFCVSELERLISQEQKYKRKGSGEVNPSFSGEEEELSYFPGQEHEFGSAPMNEDVCPGMERVRGRLAFGRLVFFSLNALRSACISAAC